MDDPLRFEDEKPPLALIAGPTASGKSGYAVKLARQVEDSGRRAVILNADSAQVYRDLLILSARPTEDDMGGIEHRLFGAWDGTVACSAADWAQAAKVEITAIHANGGVPILVGGTGLYLRTLLDGIAPVPAIDPAVRNEIRAMPQNDARAALEIEDAQSAAKLDPADSARTMRALEVVRSTGKPIDYWRSEKRGGIGDHVTLDARILLPERQILYERCDHRFAAMIENGAVAEVETLLERKLDPALPVMRAIGVRQITAFLNKTISRQTAVELGQRATRQYAKRQYTWFRRQPPPEWQRLESLDG